MTQSVKAVLALALFGAATWVAAMLSGQLIVLATGVPASSGILNGFVVPFLLVLGLRAVPHSWHVTLAFTVYGALAIPTVLLGPPGVHKLAVAFVAGVGADLVIRVIKGKLHHFSYILSFAVWALLLVVMARLAFDVDALQLPGKEKFVEAFPVMAAVFIVEAAIGAFLASNVFDRRSLAEHPSVERLQAWLNRKP